MVDSGSRRNAPATTIGQVDGTHDDDSDTLNTAERKQIEYQIITK